MRAREVLPWRPKTLKDAAKERGVRGLLKAIKKVERKMPAGLCCSGKSLFSLVGCTKSFSPSRMSKTPPPSSNHCQ